MIEIRKRIPKDKPGWWIACRYPVHNHGRPIPPQESFGEEAQREHEAAREAWFASFDPVFLLIREGGYICGVRALIDENQSLAFSSWIGPIPEGDVPAGWRERVAASEIAR